VLLHLEEVPRQKKPLVDLAAIELYDNALGQVLGTVDDWARIIGEIRWQCVKAIPKDEDISLKCFKACLLKKDLDHARQVCLTINLSSKLLLTPSLDRKQPREKFSK
jgi:N-terminal acetyltransferase B complex non-catalytic subunit